VVKANLGQKDSSVDLQRSMRAVFQFVSQSYGSLTDEQKAEWITAGESDLVTGMNAAIGFNQTHVREGHGVRAFPSATQGVPVVSVNFSDSFPKVTEIQVNWTSAGGDPPQCFFLYAVQWAFELPTVVDLKAITGGSTRSYTLTALKPGTAYGVMIVACDFAGFFGDAALALITTKS